MTKLDFSGITSRLKHLSYALIPHYCELCQAQSDKAVCHYCLARLHVGDQSPRCQMCDVPISSEAELCGECLLVGHSFDKILTGFVFQQPLSTLINRFKHQRHHYAAHPLLPTLIQRIRQHYRELPQVIIPVPIHWTKRLSRGYNQSEILAHELARQLNIPWQAAVKKAQRTPMQQGLSRKQRIRNLRKSFTCSHVPYQHVALVDDVVTTGATSEEIAHLLKRHGVEQVDIWALARTPK